MERARPAVLRKVLAFAFLRQADGTRREPNMRQDPVPVFIFLRHAKRAI
jgi:hypothetical protein